MFEQRRSSQVQFDSAGLVHAGSRGHEVLWLEANLLQARSAPKQVLTIGGAKCQVTRSTINPKLDYSVLLH